MRIGDLKKDEAFNEKSGEVWREWENQTNLWWSAVCEEEKEAGGWLKGSQGSIQEMVKGKKAPDWNNSTAWERVERLTQEAIGTWARWNPSTGGEGWTGKVTEKTKKRGRNLGWTRVFVPTWKSP